MNVVRTIHADQRRLLLVFLGFYSCFVTVVLKWLLAAS